MHRFKNEFEIKLFLIEMCLPFHTLLKDFYREIVASERMLLNLRYIYILYIIIPQFTISRVTSNCSERIQP